MEKRIRICFIFALSLLITTIGCTSTQNNTNAVEDADESNGNYRTFTRLVPEFQDDFVSSSYPLVLTDSTVNSTTFIGVSREMSFGKKDIMSLENGYEYPTQHHLMYSDKINNLYVMIDFIFTDVNQGSNLLFSGTASDINPNQMDTILSYENTLIHIQVKYMEEIDDDFNLTIANCSIIEDIVGYLDTHSNNSLN